MPRWIPAEPGEESGLLEELGIRDVDELFRDIPAKFRLKRLGLGPGLPEAEVVRSIDRILNRNEPYSDFANFMGGRIAVHDLPAAVDAVLSRSEFYTSYTPYQPEASQGMLQALFEFQSLWTELTGMDAANASLYDGATAQGEAMLLCRRVHEGRRFLVPASLPWEERSVLENYGTGAGLKVETLPFDPATGQLDLETLRAEATRGEVCGLLVDLPNGFGGVDPSLWEVKSAIGSVPLVVAADPLALSVVDPPGNWGADVVVGEGQGFGAAPSFGGPLLGLFACRRELLRLSPGRIVGATIDAEGRRAFALTLQTREQHIRRSRATSNICTNQSLLALAFVTYASLVGPRGLAELQTRIAERGAQLSAALREVPGLKAPRFTAPHLGAFAVEVEHGRAAEFLEGLRRGGVLAGHPLADPRPSHSGLPTSLFLTCANDATDDRDIARFVSAARATLASGRGAS